MRPIKRDMENLENLDPNVGHLTNFRPLCLYKRVAKARDDFGYLAEVHQHLTDNFIFVLMHLHEFMNSVLGRLPMKALNTCAQVCKKWNSLVKKEKQRRSRTLQFVCFFIRGLRPTYSCFQTPIADLRMEPQTAIVFMTHTTYSSKVPVPGSRSVVVTSRRSGGKKRTWTSQCVNNVNTVMDFTKTLEQLLPKSSTILKIVVYNDAIVGANGTCQNLRAGSGVLLLPKSPDFQTFSFTLSKAQIDKVFNNNDPILGTKEQLCDLLNIPAGVVPKTVLIFRKIGMCDSDSIVPVERSILYHFNGKVVVAGGFLNCLVPPKVRISGLEENTFMTGMVFCGSGIQMASTVLNNKVLKEETAAARISLLKKTGISCKWSFAFMFGSGVKRHDIYNQDDFEAKAFQKVFPNIPFYGLYGCSVAGHDYLPDYSNQSHKGYTVLKKDTDCDWIEYPSVRHYATTVVVLLSLASEYSHRPQKAVLGPVNRK